MKLWILSLSLTVSLLILSGCSVTPTPASKENIVIDNSLSSVTLTKHGVIAGMNSVAFEWHSIKNPSVLGVYIYKKSPSTKKEVSRLEYFKTIKGRYRTHFLDKDVTPNNNYTYVFKTYSEKGESKKSQEVYVKTLPILDSVAWIHSITGLPRTAKIIWRPHENKKVKAYIVERKTLEDEKWEDLSTLNGRLNAEFIDANLKDNYVYMYRVKVLTYDNIISKPSNSVKVVTKALPQPIQNIHATTNLPHRIELRWNAVKSKDFYQYYLYRSSFINGRYELIAKLYNNSFVDRIEKDAKTYFYRVSSVDKDGLESEYIDSSIQGMTLVPPEAPAVVEAKQFGEDIEVRWNKKDNRAVYYMVTQKQRKGWFNESTIEYEDIKKRVFVDHNVEADSVYSYRVYAIDKFGIKSASSVEVKVVTPESNKIVTESKRQIEPTREYKTSKPIEVPAKDIIAPTEDLDLSGL